MIRVLFGGRRGESPSLILAKIAILSPSYPIFTPRQLPRGPPVSAEHTGALLHRHAARHVEGGPDPKVDGPNF